MKNDDSFAHFNDVQIKFRRLLLFMRNNHNLVNLYHDSYYLYNNLGYDVQNCDAVYYQALELFDSFLDLCSCEHCKNMKKVLKDEK